MIERKIVACLAALTLTWVSASASEPFVSASNVAETTAQIRKLPTENIWWKVMGEDMRWNNLNLERFYPAVNVYRAGPVRELARAPEPAIPAFEIDTPAGRMPFQNFLDSAHSTTMAVLVLHRGRIAYEHYPRQQPYEKPIYWSVTKALVGTLAFILQERGELDVDRPVEHYLPELAGSSYAGATVRHILDMSSGVNCYDEYESWDSCYHLYSAAIGEDFRNPGVPDNPYDFVAGLDVGRFAEPGTSYAYSGVDTFVAGWVVEKITGMPFQDAFSREIWTRIGAEGDASILSPRYAIPLTSGGLLARVRDVGRFGLLFTPSWNVVSDERLISAAHLELILHGGKPQLLKNSVSGDQSDPQVRHNVYQWDLVYTNDDFTKGGWGGQGLLINPKRDLVAVWTGYMNAEGRDDGLLDQLRTILAGVYGEGR